MAKRLLIVDDEETLTFSLYQSFIRAASDYEIVTAGSGEEAIERIKEQPFDVVVTDILMPGIDGFEVLKFLKDACPSTDVVMMTAYGSNLHKERAMNEGARFYVEKPFEIKDFKKMILGLLK